MPFGQLFTLPSSEPLPVILYVVSFIVYSNSHSMFEEFMGHASTADVILFLFQDDEYVVAFRDWCVIHGFRLRGRINRSFPIGVSMATCCTAPTDLVIRPYSSVGSEVLIQFRLLPDHTPYFWLGVIFSLPLNEYSLPESLPMALERLPLSRGIILSDCPIPTNQNELDDRDFFTSHLTRHRHSPGFFFAYLSSPHLPHRSHSPLLGDFPINTSVTQIEH